MEYKYCKNENFEDLACGRVLIHRGGFPNFPARLAQEIFCRCAHYIGKDSGIRLYDPCCGGGYLLTVLGFLNTSAISTIYASDINPEALALAENNLALLTVEGMEKRRLELERLYSEYGKDSHKAALASAERLAEGLQNAHHPPKTIVFRNDLLTPEGLQQQKFKADLVFFDVPYGNLVSWEGEAATVKLLDHLLPVLAENAVVTLCSDKGQKFTSERYHRLEKQRIGKRQFQIFTPV